MPRKRRFPRPDELELWKRVADTTTPISGRVQELLAAEPPPDNHLPPAPDVARKPIAPFSIGSRADSSPPSVFPPPSPPFVQVRMDPRKFAKLRKGKIEPEARIDLHGMTLAQAHPALTGFVLRARADGRRLVLVITGKGRHALDHDPVPGPVGVLKRNVPQWLQSGQLQPIVQQVLEAHTRHGGSGALYVYLRRDR